jgi:hypothetical protein
MRVALLLSGLTRSALSCYENLHEVLLSKHDVDIYISTYKQSNISGGDDTKQEFTEDDVESVIELYKPKKIIVEDYNFLKNEFVSKYSRYTIEQTCIPIRQTSSFYKLNNVFELVPEGYDIYIASRMDVLFLGDFNLESFLNKKTLSIPSNSYKQTTSENGYYYSRLSDNLGILNAIAVGNYENVKCYCSIYQYLDELCLQDGHIFHPEFLTLKYLQKKSIQIERFDLDFALYRKSF